MAGTEPQPERSHADRVRTHVEGTSQEQSYPTELSAMAEMFLGYL